MPFADLQADSLDHYERAAHRRAGGLKCIMFGAVRPGLAPGCKSGRIRGVAAAAMRATLASLLAASAPARANDVLSSRFDDQRTGADLEETILTPDSVKADFGWLFSYKTNDDVYAQPLYVSDLQVAPGKTRNVLYV